jgi:hypothetical protein
MPDVDPFSIFGPGSSTSLDTTTSDLIGEGKYNQLQYETEIWLDNSGGESTVRRLAINPNAIVNMTINETLASWVTRGTMTILYPPEGSPNIFTGAFGQSINTDSGRFVYRNDGLDLLRVRIRPKSGPANGLSYNTESDRKFWTLSYLFSVYEKEEIDLPQGAINAAGNNIKALKLYFWDCWYQRLKTRVIQYSTALSLNAKIDTSLDNGTQGVLYTGEAIKEIIDIGLSQGASQVTNPADFIDSSIGAPLGFNYNPTFDIGTDFNRGIAKLFYTAPAGATAYDSLMYVYNKHVSNDESISSPASVQPPRGGRPPASQIFDFCILRKEKGPNDTDIGRLSLKSVSQFFKEAGNSSTIPGPYQIEHFFLQSYEADSAGKMFKAPRGGGATVDISTTAYSYIQNYRFVDISPDTNASDFCNRPVHSFDYRGRTLNIEYEENTVLAARKFMAKKYIDKLYKEGPGENLFLITLENEKRDLNFKPVFSNDGDNPNIRQCVGLQKLLKTGLFLNAAINFRTLGLPHREAGRFIAIDKVTGAKSGEFEDKFYGQWFIIDIKHIFESEIYYNDITAIKIHRFSQSPVTFPGAL